jgi:phosphohistidine phosphatase SixA
MARFPNISAWCREIDPIRPDMDKPMKSDNAVARIVQLASCLFMCAAIPQAVADDAALWQKLKSGARMIVLMRHAEPAGGNPLTWDESGNCEGESMLTANGKSHAKRIGEAFASRGIKPAVMSSPMCRCLDTAKIAFGEDVITNGGLREVASADAQRARLFERRARAMIGRRLGAGPLVFVSHRPNIDLLTMELVDSGELLVGRVDEKGEIDVLGKIRVQ